VNKKLAQLLFDCASYHRCWQHNSQWMLTTG